MADEINWAEKWAEADAFQEKNLEKLASRGGIDREFFGACLAALRGSREGGLFPRRDADGNFHYTPEQGFKAACQGREDAAANLLVQRAVLERLQALQWTAWLCVLLLGYIAYRVS